MVEHPNLVERPLVESPRGVVMARPKERVREIL
jgi:arsenate reductase-like glutaredoxin family protein